MNIDGDGGQPTTARNLPAASSTGPPAGPRQPKPGPRAPAPSHNGEVNLAELARQARRERRSSGHLIEADYELQAPVKHPDGGDRSVAETLADQEEQRKQIVRQTSMGSRMHRRLAQWLRLIPKFVLCFDFGLLLYFLSGITNVNWASPLSANLAFAAALAAMVTVLAYGFLSFTGHRMRSHKNHAGSIHLDELDGFTKAAFGTAIAVITVLGVLMFLRMRAEIFNALGPRAGLSALVIPLAVAVVSAVANFLVILVHALDGSDEVARLERLAAATRRPARKAHQLRRRAARQAHR